VGLFFFFFFFFWLVLWVLVFFSVRTQVAVWPRVVTTVDLVRIKNVRTAPPVDASFLGE